ncbi:hypothetical protein CCH79_00016876, partial [Gambusia affinis]
GNMKSFDKSLEIETEEEDNVQKQENNSEASHNITPLLLDSWKPYKGTRANVKEQLLKLRDCLESVCGIQWYGFAAMGILAAVLSFLMDFSVAKLLRAHLWLYEKLEGHILLQFLCWTLYPACICAFASTFSHNICPFSTGSGIPEVRTMLSGIELPHYLSLTNMFTKFLGLTCTLAAGSTVSLGKVGPFVHLSTMLGAYLDRLCRLVQGKKKVRELLTDRKAIVERRAVPSACQGVGQQSGQEDRESANTGMKYPAGRGSVQARTNIHISESTTEEQDG